MLKKDHQRLAKGISQGLESVNVLPTQMLCHTLAQLGNKYI